jgi:hypothetical protein
MLEEVANYFSESDLMVAAVNCWYPTSDCAKVLACSVDAANMRYLCTGGLSNALFISLLISKFFCTKGCIGGGGGAGYSKFTSSP